MLVNNHFHDRYSPDGKGSLEERIILAIKKGITHLAITNHAETWPYGPTEFFIDEAKERFLKTEEEIKILRKKYPEISLAFGIELDMSVNFQKQHEILQSMFDFDVRIGSIHNLNSIVITIDEAFDYFKDKKVEKILDEYFKKVLSGIKWGYLDQVGHLDVIERKLGEFLGVHYDYTKHLDILAEIAEEVKKRNLVIEINMSGSHSSKFQKTFPRIEIIEFLVKQGVKRFTVGNDAHYPEDIASHLKEGMQILESFNLKPVVY
jgi:histidinol-phosphatase (PHP family)